MKTWLTSIKHAYERITTQKHIAFILKKSERFSALQLSDASAAMTYYLSMALFPFAIFLTAVLARVGQRLSVAGNLDSIKALIPEPVLDFIAPIVEQITANYQLSLLSVGALSILWASARGFDTFLFYTDRTYGHEPKPFLLKKVLGLLFILILTVTVILMLVSVAFGSLLFDQLARWTNLPIFSGLLLNTARLLLPFVLLTLILSLLYRALSRREGPFSYCFLAAIAPTVTWFALSWGLGWYIDRFTKYSLIYGSLTGLVLLMFWLFLLMQTIFLGAFIHSECLQSWRAAHPESEAR